MGVCLSLLSCRQPQLGERTAGAATNGRTRIVLEDAWLDLHGHVVATFAATESDLPLGADEVMALAPRFTLATLKVHPVDGFSAWKSQLLTGAQVAARLPPGGPGTPEGDVVLNARQPGYEAPASLVALGEGRYRHVFANALTELEPDEIVRVGVWLAKAEEPTEGTSSTIDFRPSSGVVDEQEHELVLDRNCQSCHHLVESTSGATGVRICVTCHTWQHSDPDTIDPAALVTAATTAQTDPNPLEFGRMIHRIHRGKDLPTIYASSWDPAGPSTVPSAAGLPVPFIQHRPGLPAASNRNPYPWRKYSVVGRDRHERVFAQALLLTPVDPSVATTASMLLAAGGMFPRDLRDCAVCHGDAQQGDVTASAVSRRTCSGCHPEVWYGASPPLGDPVRFPHPGGPQANDGECLGCHVTGTPKLYAPIVEAHVPPARAPRYNQPFAAIVKVEHLKGGERPVITFRLYDRVGPIAPKPNAPVPAWEPEGLTTGYGGLDPAGLSTSYVPRKLTALLIKIIGPTTPDYSSFSSFQMSSGAAAGNPDPLTLSATSGTDEYVYTFSSIIPPGTTGTFAVGMEAARTVTLPHYDKAKDVFPWPFTGEPVRETAENAIVYVNSANGLWTAAAGSAGAVPRRTVVDQQKCLRCHDRIEFHGGQKHDAMWCITCHTHDETDLDKRLTTANAGRVYPGGPLKIGATYDGIEERSTHLKMKIHRIHTGSRKGSASLEGIAPYLVYYGKAYFFDRGGFPNDLRNCTLCHAGKSYLIESIPADAPATIANEQPTIWHATGAAAHGDGEPALLPIQAACTGCHATGATFAHVASKTVDGVETCAQCHEKGSASVEVAHGLAPPGGGAAATFSSIVAEVLVPRCASSACHGAGATPPVLDASAAYAALVNAPSGQSALPFVKPGAPDESYLVYKLRGDAGAVGGSVLSPMPPPPDSLLDPADVAAIEAWIVNGAPND